jgi:hypothetical protein
MSEELKPCPKCGPDGAPLRCIGEMYEYRVECVECHTVQTPCFKTLKEAEAYWNAFAEGMTQQAARIAELEKENREQLIDYENRLCEARKYQQDAVRRCEELEAERDRLREALQEIISCQPEMCLARYCCRKCESMAGIAREALEGAENE